MYQIEPGSDQLRRDALHVVDAQALRREFVGRKTQAQRSVTDRLLDALDHTLRQTQTARFVAAPGILTAIGQRRQELRQQIAVSTVKLEDLVAGLYTQFGGAPEAFDQMLDLVVGQGARGEPARVAA